MPGSDPVPTTFANVNPEPTLDHHRFICWLLIGLAAATMMGRLMTVRSSGGATPMLSANDRSRWATIRALVDEGTYVLDRVIFSEDGQRDPAWYSIDLVQHRGLDGRQHFYSSKPTLLTTLLAAPYWVLHQLGVSIHQKPYYVMRITLVVVQVIPTVMFLVLLLRFLARLTDNLWSREFVLATACLATPLTTFSISLNNHTPAALWTLVCVWIVWEILHSPQLCIGRFLGAGLAAAMAVACELPALSLLVLVAAAMAWRSPWYTLAGFVPPVLIVVAGALGTNYLAHGTWSTPYAHRRDGAVILEIATSDLSLFRPGPIAEPLRQQLAAGGLQVSDASALKTRPLDRGYELWDPQQEARYAVWLDSQGVTVREWDNWYEYEGSYWAGNTSGVDRGEPSRWVYAFHALAGHHGIFSLTPVWLLGVAGTLLGLRRTSRLRPLAAATALLTLVCLSFYILLRPLEDRNYGGVSCCFRWTIWLIPLWLPAMIPILERIAAHRTGRYVALGLLVLSIFSTTYNSRNPWSHPWLFDYWSHLGWIRYG
ncbi:MAG: hypothetical protein AB7F89_11870 [Pirellulaceae bacterium]